MDGNENKNNISIQKRVENVFNKVFEGKLKFSPNLIKGDPWDSLKQVEFVVSLEKEFKTRFTGEEASRMNGIKKILKILQKFEGA